MQYEFHKTAADEHGNYRQNVKKTLVVTLVLFNLIALLSPRLDVLTEGETEAPKIVIDVENIPVTRQQRKTPPPPKPKVPIPSDNEAVPEDATIEETTLKYTNVYDLTDGLPEMSGLRVIPPKLINLTAPEMPEEEFKKGIKGTVRLSVHIDKKGKVVEVVVIDNTTQSEKCAQAAVEAAYGSRFFPARENNQTVSAWSSITYGFNSNN